MNKELKNQIDKLIKISDSTETDDALLKAETMKTIFKWLRLLEERIDKIENKLS